MVVLNVNVKDSEDVEEILNKLRIYRRLTPDRYIACIGSQGITLIPLVASRHSHVIVFSGFETLEGLTKSIDLLRNKGFVIVENCNVRPSES